MQCLVDTRRGLRLMNCCIELAANRCKDKPSFRKTWKQNTSRTEGVEEEKEEVTEEGRWRWGIQIEASNACRGHPRMIARAQRLIADVYCTVISVPNVDLLGGRYGYRPRILKEC